MAIGFTLFSCQIQGLGGQYAVGFRASIWQKRPPNLSDLTEAAAARTNLGIGLMVVQNSGAVVITGGSVDGLTLDGGTF